MKIWTIVAAALALSCVPLAVSAQNEPAPAEPAHAPMTGLTRRTGVIQLPQAKARLDMGKDYYFLDAKDAKRVLTEAWGNPPDVVEGVLGMILPNQFAPDDDRVWGAVVTFKDIGFVEDKDARTTDYDKLLVDLRKGEDDDNAQRKKQGFKPMHLAGWAEAPQYDAANHVLIWAQDLQIEGNNVDTLNYDIRVLGRYGVLSLNAVGAMSDFANIRAAAASVRQTAQFDAGSRYTDVDKSKDKLAGIGLAGLIAAGAGAVVVKKAGLLALLLAFGKKFIVIIVALGAGIANWVRTKLGLKPKTPATSAEPSIESSTSQSESKPPDEDGLL